MVKKILFKNDQNSKFLSHLGPGNKFEKSKDSN